MKIPKHIQDKMHRVAKLHSQANTIMVEVDEWFRNKGYNDAFIRSGNGISLEELELGNDITDRFCQSSRGRF